MPRGPRASEALARQPELCPLQASFRDQHPALQSGSVKPEGQEATGCGQQAQHAGGGTFGSKSAAKIISLILSAVWGRVCRGPWTLDFSNRLSLPSTHPKAQLARRTAGQPRWTLTPPALSPPPGLQDQ